MQSQKAWLVPAQLTSSDGFPQQLCVGVKEHQGEGGALLVSTATKGQGVE